MVEVRYRSRFGNRLFQYCFARIIAEQLGFALRADPIPGFPGTAENVSGQAHGEPTTVLDGHVVDVGSIVRDRSARRIVVDGYFQRYEYYRAHADVIRRRWLRPDDGSAPGISQDDLVAHVRLGDYLFPHQSALPISFYDEVMRRAGRYGRLIVCTDDPDDPVLRRFEDRGALIRRATAWEDFIALRSARRIVLSQSTFSWWAAFLSDAEQIFFPVPARGFWSSDRPDIDLHVDEPRYLYVPCGEMDRPTQRESLIRLWNRLRRRARRGAGPSGSSPSGRGQVRGSNAASTNRGTKSISSPHLTSPGGRGT